MTDGTVLGQCQDNGARYLTHVRYRIPFVTTVYTRLCAGLTVVRSRAWTRPRNIIDSPCCGSPQRWRRHPMYRIR
jgi:hypothetical protein